MGFHCCALFIFITFMYFIIICIAAMGSVFRLDGLVDHGSARIFLGFVCMDLYIFMVGIDFEWYAYRYDSDLFLLLAIINVYIVVVVVNICFDIGLRSMDLHGSI